jgi:hypothetical protein
MEHTDTPEMEMPFYVTLKGYGIHTYHCPTHYNDPLNSDTSEVGYIR